jgi:hypothetical protein
VEFTFANGNLTFQLTLSTYFLPAIAHAIEITGGNLMKNHDNQPTERKIYLKDLHQWVSVSKADYDNYYRDINAYRRRQQEHGRCVCPANKRYLCDMDCWTCRFHKAGDELSLDYTVTDDDGNEKSWLDDLADDAPSAQSIMEEQYNAPIK